MSLHDLHQQGALSVDEYQQAKQHVVDGGVLSKGEAGTAPNAPGDSTASEVPQAPFGHRRGKLFIAAIVLALAVGAAVALAVASGVGEDTLTAAKAGGGAGAEPGGDLADEGCWLPFETASGELECAEGFVTEGQKELTPATFARLRLVGVSSTRADGSAKADCEVAEDVLNRATRGQELTAEDLEYSLRPGGGLRGTVEGGAGTSRDYDILVACMWLIVSPGD